MRMGTAWTAVAALLVVAAGCAENAVQAPPATLEQAQALAAKTHKPILIDFATEW